MQQYSENEVSEIYDLIHVEKMFRAKNIFSAELFDRLTMGNI